jgi:hypothetical protein
MEELMSGYHHEDMDSDGKAFINTQSTQYRRVEKEKAMHKTRHWGGRYLKLPQPEHDRCKMKRKK